MKRDGHSAKRKILPLFLCLLLSLTMVPTVALAEDGRSGDIPSGNVSAAGDGAKGGALAGPDAQGGSSDGAEGEDIGGSGDTDKEGSGDSESESGEDSDGSGTTDLPSDKEDEGDPVPGDGSASGQDSSAAAPDDKASPDADAPSALPNEAEPQVPPTDDEASQADALSLAPNDSPDTQSYMGITVRRTNLYTEPSAEAAVADYFWPGILRNGFSRWDVAGEWLTVWYEGVQYYTKASDVSLNDAADGSRYAGITLGRANFYEYPSTAAPVRDFFWGGVVYGGFSAWDASGDWLTFSYEGQRCFIKASYVLLNDATDTAARRGFATSGALLYETPSSSATVLAAIGSGATLSGLVPWDAAGKWFSVSYQGAQGFVPSASVVISDATDVSGYTGVTLRRANLYAAPDASQDPVDFFWGGVLLSGYSRVDAAGQWLTIMYAGQRYYVKAADVSLNDAAGASGYTGVTLRRANLYASPDASQDPVDFFWGGVVLSGYSRWDAAGEWLAIVYAGQRYYVKAADVSLNDGSGSFTGYFSERTNAYGLPSEEAGPVDFFWGGVAASVSRWDAGGEWCTLVYGGETLFIRTSALSIGDSPDGRSYRGTTLTRTNLYVAPSLQAEVGDFFWADITWSGFQHWDAAGEWLTVAYAGVRYFVRAENVELDDGSANSVEVPTGISLDAMLDLEYASVSQYHSYSREEVLHYLNPSTWGYGEDEYYQFAVLDDGYSGKVTAAQLNAFINSTLDRYGYSNSVLRDSGATIIAASQRSGMNEVYLMAHAILESGWGTSTLARGYYYNGTDLVNGKTYPAGTYYNLYGIGAYDSDPLWGGRYMAISQGWNSVENALTGAGDWVERNYAGNSYRQNTLYEMRWNYVQASREGTVWMQYATSITWATGIADIMADFYRYAGIDMIDTGLTFEVPSYS